MGTVTAVFPVVAYFASKSLSWTLAAFFAGLFGASVVVAWTYWRQAQGSKTAGEALRALIGQAHDLREELGRYSEKEAQHEVILWIIEAHMTVREAAPEHLEDLQTRDVVEGTGHEQLRGILTADIGLLSELRKTMGGSE